MTKLHVILIALSFCASNLAYNTTFRAFTPRANNYSASSGGTLQGLASLLPSSNTFSISSPIQTITTTTTQQSAPVVQAPVVQAPVAQAPVYQAPVAQAPVYQAPTYQTQAAHNHQAPVYRPQPMAAAVSHSHGPQIPIPQPPAPGVPHMHSGHPYIAPAVAPQNMTYQQIIEYLVNSNGVGLNNILRNGSGNFLTQCKAYCDTLPPSPTCDSTNVLYRNECEAKCIHKTVSTNTLRYGMCCCSDDDFAYSVNGTMLVAENNVTGTNPVQNLCISTCIYNCLGEESSIESEHTDVNLSIGRSGALCGNVQ